MSGDLHIERKTKTSRVTMALIALLASGLTFGITFGVMQYSNSTNGPAKHLNKMGAVFMSPTELVQQVKTLGGQYFWLGPVDESVFTAVTTQEGVGTVIYWPAGTNAINFNIPRRVVRVYPSLTVYASENHPTNKPEDIREIRYTNGKMQYGIRNMDYQTFIYADGGPIVEIHYAAPQSASALEANAALLSQIS